MRLAADMFNVVSLVMLSIALLESIGVHYLLRRNMDVVVASCTFASARTSTTQHAQLVSPSSPLRCSQALFLDKVFRVILPMGVYVCMVVGMLVYGTTGDMVMGILIGYGGALGCVLMGLIYVKFDVMRTMKARKLAVEALSTAAKHGGCEVYSKELNDQCRHVFL